MSRRHEAALIDFLWRNGAEDIRVENGSKHRIIRFTWNGEAMIHVGHFGPRDHRNATKLALADLRRMMGLRTRGAPRHERRRHRRGSAEPGQAAPPKFLPVPPPRRRRSTRYFDQLALALQDAGIAA